MSKSMILIRIMDIMEYAPIINTTMKTKKIPSRGLMRCIFSLLDWYKNRRATHEKTSANKNSWLINKEDKSKSLAGSFFQNHSKLSDKSNDTVPRAPNMR